MRNFYIYLVCLVASFSLSMPNSSFAASTIYSVLVGINDYAPAGNPVYSASNLQGPKNDVALVKSLLIKTYGVPDDKEHFTILLDGNATHSGILKALSETLRDKAKSDPDATFLFYFSGHGSLAVDDNGDEGDGYDETLVAYDSRAADGTDIRDDEIEKSLAELAKYTKNIVVILDSCHSGTATRDPTLRSRRAPFDTRTEKAAISLPSGNHEKDTGSVTNPDRVYSIITGSLAEEVSNEDVIETEEGARYQGLLTYYLVQALKWSPHLTYQAAVFEAERFIHERVPSQHPQAEGDFDRIVFGGIGSREVPFIPITAVAGDTFSIAAGQAQGIRIGAILAVYSNKATKLIGEDQKIAQAIVENADIGTSVAKIQIMAKEPITTSSKVRVVSPYSGKDKFAVAIAVPPKELGAGVENSIASALTDRLANNTLVQLIPDPGTATFLIKTGCLANNAQIPMEQVEALSQDCDKTLYVSPRGQQDAMFGYHVSANDINQAVTGLVDVLEKAARQENIRTLANGVSPLAGTVTLSLVRIEVEDKSGKLAITRETPINASLLEALQQGEFFRFIVKNSGTQDIFYSIIGLGTSGSVFILGDAPSGEKLKAGMSTTTKPALKVGPPFGIESYVLLATTTPVNVRFLEAPGVKARDPGPLGWLLDGLANSGFRDPVKVPEIDLNSWATTRLDFEIRP
jgi:hypothetical protein